MLARRLASRRTRHSLLRWSRGARLWQVSGKTMGPLRSRFVSHRQVHKSAVTAAPKTSAPSAARNSRGTEGDSVMGFEGLTKTLPGGRVLLENATLQFYRGAKIGMLGVNGAGKSSLLRLLAGVDKEFDGNLWHEEGLRIGYLAQEPELDHDKDVRGNIMDGLKEKTDLLDRFTEISMAMAEPDADFDDLMEKQSEVQAQIDLLDAWNLEHMVAIAKKNLNVPPDNANVSSLSGGERRRVALCRLLLEHPEVLLLDEPTNHLDADSVKWLEEFLRDYKGTVIAITHDRYFLDNVAGWILEVDRGQLIPYEGNYTSWLERRSARMKDEAKSDKRLQKAIEEELQWIRQGQKGQQKKSSARIAAFEKKQDNLIEKKSRERFLGGAIAIPPGPRLGNTILELEDITHSVPIQEDGRDTGERRTLINSFSMRLPKGAIVGVVGANGTGKTTLMRIISGELEPERGTVRKGDTVLVSYVDQGRHLDDDARVLEVVAEGQDEIPMGDRSMPIMHYLAKFNLSGSMAGKRVKGLSGGERSRVHLARALRMPANMLILDEPTNDLDVDTLRSLEEALQDYGGCAFVVSHDRYFLDRVATHTLHVDQQGQWEFFPGSWTEYLQWQKQQAKEQAA